MKKILFIFLIFTIHIFAYTIDPETIIKKMEYNQVHDTAFIKGKMIISDRFGDKKISFTSFSRGEEEALIEFTSIEEEGQKILRTKNELYLFFPDAQELIRLQGSALRDSVLGSDMSYEDLTGNKGLVKKYELSFLGSEIIENRPCYKIKLKAKNKMVPYAIQIIWIDSELFYYKKIQQFTVSEKLLKEIRINKVINKKNKIIPVEIVLESKIKKNSKTIFITENIDIDIKIPEKTFSFEELTW